MSNIISAINNKITLEFLLNSPEWIYFERKSMQISTTKLANSIIAMANAEWGIVVLWINDWVIEDLKSLDNTTYNNFKQIWIDYIKPPTNFKIEEVEIEWKTVFLYHIEPDYERLFSKKDWAEDVYLRVWDETRKLNRDEVRNLEYDKSLRKYEDEIVEDFDENDFRMSVVNYYKDTIVKYNWDFRDLFVNRYLAIKKDWKYYYKRSAILLFAEDPEKYISSASVRYIRYDWNISTTWTQLNIIKDERFSWCIPRLIELIKKFLQTVLKDYYFLDLDSWKFIKISEYPEWAWLEWIVNALTHRSYNLHWNVVLIKHYNDRLEISNSWPLPSFVTPENITENRYARNPRIARILNDFWYVRELNEWVKRIFEVMQKYFLSKPEYIDKNNIVTLILKNNTRNDNRILTEHKRLSIEKELSKLPDTSKNIIIALSQNNWLNLKGLSTQLWIKEVTIREHLRKLVDKWLIQKHSELQRDKNALYTL